MKNHKWLKLMLLGLLSIIFTTACGQNDKDGNEVNGEVESVTLRSESAELDNAALLEGCKANSLYIPGENIQGSLKLTDRFEAVIIMEQKVVNDPTTGLMWQQDEDVTRFTWKEAEAYLTKMNTEKFAGFDNWRIPTAEELASLLMPTRNGNYFIDPVFNKEMLSTWSADQVKDVMLGAWFLDYYEGKPSIGNRAAGMGHVRLVRNI